MSDKDTLSENKNPNDANSKSLGAESKQLTNKLQQAEQELFLLYEKANALSDAQKEVQQRLQSYSFAALEFLGMRGDTERVELEKGLSEEALMEESTESLSRDGLSRKDEIIEIWLKQIEKDILQKQEQVAFLKKEQNAIRLQEKLSKKEELAAKIKAECLANPENFYGAVLLKVVPRQAETETLYESARKVVAASSVLPAEDNRYKIIEAWKIVSAARERAYSRYKSASKENKGVAAEDLSSVYKEFYEDAKKCFGNMVDKLAPEWQKLKALYEYEPEIAEEYFEKAGVGKFTTENLQKHIHAGMEKKARKKFSAMQNFGRMSPEEQNVLIGDQIHVYMLEFDLVNAPAEERAASLQQISKCSRALSDNIKNALEQHKTPEEIAAEREQIYADIDAEMQKIRMQAFIQRVTTDKDMIGVAGGAAYFLGGVGLLGGAAVAATAAVAKAAVETSPSRMRAPDNEEKRLDAERLRPEEYKIWYKAKERWDELDGTTTEPEVEIQTIRQDIDDTVTSAKNSVENFTTDLRNIVYMGLSAVTLLAAVTVTIIVPPAWPVLAIVGLAALGGIGYSAVQKYNDPDQPAPTFLGPIVEAGYNAVSYVGTAIKNSMGNLFSKVSTTGTKQSTFATEENSQDKFLIPPTSMQALQEISPQLGSNFAKKLVDHFQGRLEELTQSYKMVKLGDSQTSLSDIEKALNRLEEDWRKIVKSSHDPRNFCESVSAYLEGAFIQEKERMVGVQAEAMTFSDAAKVKQDVPLGKVINTTVAQEERYLDELVELKKATRSMMRAM